MKKPGDKTFSPEVLAAYLDGNATPQESNDIIRSLVDDYELREIMHISQAVDVELSLTSDVEYLPMTALAANCEKENYCCLECEKYILTRLGFGFDEKQLLQDAIKNGWQKKEGTALHNIGRHLEKCGLVVNRRFKCTTEDIVKAIGEGCQLIVAVDGGELIGDPVEELKEDVLFGQIPDHTVVVLACDAENDRITLFDPDSPHIEDVYPISRFADAWADSKNYLVTIRIKDMNEYIPNPIDISDVELSEDLNELREAIAENAHEIWAENRMAEGWTYGPVRNDELKHNPDLIPYSMLPESEKEYDRQMAIKTIKLLIKLGYDLIKREDTELYKVLKKRIQTSEDQYFCRKCKNPIYKHQVFCDNCGLKLDMDWE